jgi:hypothetical protein
MTPDGARPTMAPPPSQQPPQRLLLGISSLTLDAPMGHVLAVALDAATGREVARATAPCRSWWHAVERLPNVALASVAGACAALPTRDPSRDLAELERELSSRLPPSARVMAVQEGAAALAAAAGAGAAAPAVAVALVADEHVCAYGSTAAAPPPPSDAAAPLACPHAQQQQQPPPNEVRVSGWGPRFSDGGSALDLGQRALAAASKASDGRGAPTSLVRDLARHLGLAVDGQDDARALADWAYNGGQGDDAADGAFQRRVCALAPVVDRACAAGDAVAETILRHGVGELFRCVVVAAARLGVGGVAGGTAASASAAPVPPPPTSFRVVLAGALLRPGTSYAQLLAEALKDHAPAAVVAHLPSPAAAAAGGGGVEPAIAAARMLLLPHAAAAGRGL